MQGLKKCVFYICNLPLPCFFPKSKVDIMRLKVLILLGIALAILPTLRTQAQNNSGCFTLAIEDIYGAPGQQVCVDFTTENMNDLVAIQATMTWDPDLLSFVSVTNYALPGFSSANLGNPDQVNGRLPFAWVDPSVSGVDRPDGSPMFSVCFNITGQIGENGAAINIGGVPTPIEAVDVSGNLMQLNVVPGRVFIQPATENNLRATVVCVDTTSCLIQVENGAELAVTGGVSPYSYLWSGPNGYTSTQQDLPSSAPDGVYQVVVTDNQGHSVQGRTLHDGPEVIITSITPDTLICGGTELQLEVTTIDNAQISWAQTGDLSCLDCPNPVVQPYVYTIYNVTATSTDGCSETRSVVVDARSYLDFGLLPFTNSPVCEGDTLYFNSFVFGAQSYSWTGPNGFSSQEVAFSIPNATTELNGAYQLNIIDDIGCQVSAVAQVQVVASPILEGQAVDASCSYESDGSIDLSIANASGTYTFHWSNGFTGEDPAGLPPGDYSVDVADELGCLSSADFVIGPDPIVAAVAPVAPVCFDDLPQLMITSVSGGAGEPYTYSIDGGITQHPVSTDTIAFDPDNWSGLLIYDANGCMHAPVVTIIQPPPPYVLIANEPVQPICPQSNSGAIGVEVIGAISPLTYSWSNGSVLDTNWLVGVPPGLYTLTVSDANGCQQNMTFVLFPELDDCEQSQDVNLFLGDQYQYCVDTISNEDLTIATVLCGFFPESFGFFTDGPCVNITAGPATGMDTLCLQVCRLSDPNACITVTLNVNVQMTDDTNEPLWARSIKMYPNPASDVLTVSTEDVSLKAVELIDSRGQLLNQWKQANPVLQIPVDQLPAGIYFLRLTTAEGFITRKWIKTN